ncbi:MAG: family 20 glycosylhydrolase, partial [Flavisolibacter sp.]
NHANSVDNYFIQPSTSSKQFSRFEGDKVEVADPARVYDQNKNISDIPEKDLVKVFPTPLHYSESNEVCQITPHMYVATDAIFKNEAAYLSNELEKIFGKKPLILNKSNERQIELRKNDLAPEHYKLTVTTFRITIAAGSASGIFYGIQSLKTLFPPEVYSSVQTSFTIPTVEITDGPRFSKRMFMLDVARNFQTKQEILKLLDVMSLYKLNVFHFHLNNDEGWRLQIPGLPELTDIGAKRGHTLTNKDKLQPSFGSGPDVNSSGTGYYTRQDFIEILKYAYARHIKLIPEIETPGHARAAVISMRSRYEKFMSQGKKSEAWQYMLQDPSDKSVYRSVQGWNDNVMDVSLPSTYRFLEKVVDEIIGMYKSSGVPLETIHFGGDEVPAGVWEMSPSAQQLMKKDSSLKNANDLWYYYYKKIHELLKKRNMYLYGWEEMAMRKTELDGKPVMIPNPDFAGRNVHADVWNNVIGWGAEDLAYQLANRGIKVILSPVTNTYFDMAYQKDFEEPGYYWGGFLDIDKPFSFVPLDYYKSLTKDNAGNILNKNYFLHKERLTEYGKENIVGMQGLLWGENLNSMQRFEYFLLPKLLSFAERSWAKDPQWARENDSAKFYTGMHSDWNNFLNRIGRRELPRLDHYAGGFEYRIPTAGATVIAGRIWVNAQIPGLIARYTSDGSEPVLSSPNYTEPIATKGLIKIRLFNSKGRGGRIVQIENK